MAMVTESNWEEQKVMVVCVLDSGIDAYALDLRWEEQKVMVVCVLDSGIDAYAPDLRGG